MRWRTEVFGWILVQVKHWMDPRIIPFGWGLFTEEDEVIVIENEPEKQEDVQRTTKEKEDEVVIDSSTLENIIESVQDTVNSTESI